VFLLRLLRGSERSEKWNANREEEHGSSQAKTMKRKSSTDTMGSSASSAEAHYTHRITPVGSPRSDGMNEEKAKLGESRIQLGVASIHVEPR